MRGRRSETRVDDVLAAVGLTDRANDRAGTFSGGMKRRLNLAAAVVHRPKLLLLDEPTTGVDPQSRNHIFEQVRGAERGRHDGDLHQPLHGRSADALHAHRDPRPRHGSLACDTLPNLLMRLDGDASGSRWPAYGHASPNGSRRSPARMK